MNVESAVNSVCALVWYAVVNGGKPWDVEVNCQV